MPGSPDDLLTVWQLAEHLNIGEETVRRWLRSGKLRGIRLSRKAGWRIRASDYFDFLESSSAANGHPSRMPRPWLRDQEEADDVDEGETPA